MTKAELKAYAAELAQGIADEAKRSVFLEALDNEQIANGFIPRPEFSRALDERDTKLKAADATVQKYNEWYEKQAKPVYDQSVQLSARLQRYEQEYGPLDDATAKEKKAVATAAGITKEELEKILADRDRAYVGLTKTAVRIAQDHMSRFKEPLDVDAVEKYALDNGIALDAAYDRYIAPRVEKVRGEEIEAKIKAAREEGAREALSRARTPHDAAPREGHLLFDRQAVKAEDLPNVERNARNAFFEEWNKPVETVSTNR